MESLSQPKRRGRAETADSKTGDVLTFQSHWIGKEEDQSPQVFHSGVAVLSYIGKDGGEQVLSFENEYRKRRELRFIDVWKYLLKEEAFK